MVVRILIPCKSLRRGKSRLAPLLDMAKRQAVCTRLLAHTLAVARRIVPARDIFLITSDRAAQLAARSFGATNIADPGTGLNQALRHGLDQLRKTANGTDIFIILPIDLPDLAPAALQQAKRCATAVALAPDERGNGTNLLVLSTSVAADFRLAFGPGSCRAHQQEARRLGCKPALIRRRELAFDLDTPRDYLRWYRRTAGSN